MLYKNGTDFTGTNSEMTLDRNKIKLGIEIRAPISRLVKCLISFISAHHCECMGALHTLLTYQCRLQQIHVLICKSEMVKLYL